ncbi:hypothetical protein, partial [Sandarakinorhabdus limnophila]|uniref:hypothetical protein n=1 Tax=Sandarakinorhabdus limnophila TaxID=210512 RepID=UPI0026EB52DB
VPTSAWRRANAICSPVNFDFFISKILRSKQLRFCQIPLIQTGYILRDRVTRHALTGLALPLW